MIDGQQGRVLDFGLGPFLVVLPVLYFTMEDKMIRCSHPACDAKVKNNQWSPWKEKWFITKDGKLTFCPKHTPSWVKNWRQEIMGENLTPLEQYLQHLEQQHNLQHIAVFGFSAKNCASCLNRWADDV